MGFETVRADAPSFEKLIKAIVAGDLGGGQAAIDEMALAHNGDSGCARIIQCARKLARGAVVNERPPFVLPVPGHRVGSTLGAPKLLPRDPVAECMADSERATAKA